MCSTEDGSWVLNAGEDARYDRLLAPLEWPLASAAIVGDIGLEALALCNAAAVAAAAAAPPTTAPLIAYPRDGTGLGERT